MKYTLLLLILVTSFSCIDDGSGEFRRDCPYEDIVYPGHYFRVPITITPHKEVYNIGDTINISTIFSDSIYDVSTQQTFKIEGFPFKPKTLLYRFITGASFDSGYRVNESYVDEKYEPKYTYTTNYADSYRGKAIYENEMYHFELQLILQETGRYIMLFSDQYQDNIAGGNGGANAEADAITFEGKCPNFGYKICSMIEGDDHLEFFENELIHLDEEVYSGNLASIEGSKGILGNGNLGVEFTGFYGFEVKE